MRNRGRRVGGLVSEKKSVQGSVRRSDGATEGRWDRWSSAIGARAGSGWLGLAGHGLGERESEQRRGVAEGDRLGVARDSEESRQLRERENRN